MKSPACPSATPHTLMTDSLTVSLGELLHIGFVQYILTCFVPMYTCVCERTLYSLWAFESALAHIRPLRLHTPGSCFTVCMIKFYPFFIIKEHTQHVCHHTSVVRFAIKYALHALCVFEDFPSMQGIFR